MTDFVYSTHYSLIIANCVKSAQKIDDSQKGVFDRFILNAVWHKLLIVSIKKISEKRNNLNDCTNQNLQKGETNIFEQ